MTVLPVDSIRLINVFAKFQQLFGNSFYKRAKEAVNCYLVGNYLACCVMCGASAESILLAIGYLLDTNENVQKLYRTAQGRTRLENLIFGKSEYHIKNRY